MHSYNMDVATWIYTGIHIFTPLYMMDMYMYPQVYMSVHMYMHIMHSIQR